MLSKTTLKICLIAPMTLLTGCAGIAGMHGSDPVAVRSKPSDAMVYIMDKPVGKTPLSLTQQQLYPTAYDADKEHMYGEITLKKAGCNDYRLRVGYKHIGKGVDAVLDCGGAVVSQAVDRQTAQPNAQPVGVEMQADEAAKTEASSDTAAPAKQRLQRINELKQEGLISDEEYGEVRQRILEGL